MTGKKPINPGVIKVGVNFRDIQVCNTLISLKFTFLTGQMMGEKTHDPTR